MVVFIGGGVTMKLKIFKNKEWKTLISYKATPENEKRIDELSATAFGEAIIATLMVNHELGLYDINDALNHLFKRED
jgi:hypothetical protein